MRRTAVVVAFVVVAVCSTSVPISAVGRALPQRCGQAARVPEPPTGLVPVLFVHGFFGEPRDFRRERNGHPSMLAAVAATRGVTIYTFDYSKTSSKWVTDQTIGPALAHSIRCLALASGRKVVVVAHSMGGLATRLAQGQVIEGRAVADSIARVVTIGTPTRGVILLSFTNSHASSLVVQTVADALGKLCSKPPRTKHKRLCELLDAANAPATGAMAPGSGQLAALPAWGSGVVVHPIAADLRLRISVFGYGTTVSLGDIVATVGSATADASPGQHPVVVRCHTGITDLTEVVDTSPCSHANEIANRRVIDDVRGQVRAAVDQAAKRSPSV
jgi:pimeloyl-ACP methyl ester carboxylesterase